MEPPLPLLSREELRNLLQNQIIGALVIPTSNQKDSIDVCPLGLYGVNYNYLVSYLNRSV